MKVRKLVQLIIQLCGLYGLITGLFISLPQQLTLLLSVQEIDFVVWSILSIVILITPYLAIIYGANWIIRILKIDKSFGEDVLSFNDIPKTQFFALGCFCVGGFILIDKLPFLVQNLLYTFRTEVIPGDTFQIKENLNWLPNFVSCIIGFLLVTKNMWFAKQVVKTLPNNEA